MNASERPRFAPRWLELRERADAAARAPELLQPLLEWMSARPESAGRPGSTGGLVIRDLGCGTGSMGRWLAVRLPGPQHWILHDLDPLLLAHAGARLPVTAADGTPVDATTRRGDLADLTAGDLAGSSLVTASALLDLLTREEVEALAGACVDAGSPVLLALSVAGRVELTPPIRSTPRSPRPSTTISGARTRAAPCSGRTRSRRRSRRSSAAARPCWCGPAPGGWTARNPR